MDPDTAFRAEIDPRFSDPAAAPVAWEVALDRIRAAETWLLSTVRESGAPHVTTLLAVWSDGALHFCTGTGEQKYRNLTHSPEVVLATADKGMDVVVEGTAIRVTDDDRLRVLAREWEAVHGAIWRFDVRDGAFHHGGGPAHVFAVAPRKVLGFAKAAPSGEGALSAQLRWLPNPLA